MRGLMQGLHNGRWPRSPFAPYQTLLTRDRVFIIATNAISVLMGRYFHQLWGAAEPRQLARKAMGEAREKEGLKLA